MRLIDADELKKQAYPFPCAIGVEYAVTIRTIDEAPTVDSVKHGKWEPCNKTPRDSWYKQCSVCQCVEEAMYITPYCAQCGSHMREK